MAYDFPLKIGITAMDRTSGALTQVQQRLAKITNPFKVFNRSMAHLADVSGTKRLVTSFKTLGTESRNFGGELSRLTMKSLGVGAALGGVLKLTVWDFSKAGDGIAKLSARLGISGEALQEWRYAADLAGISQQALDNTMRKFNVRIGEAAFGKGEAAPWLKALKIDLRNASGELRTVDELLPELADRFSQIKDPSAKSFLATRFFEEEGEAMSAFLAQGRAAIEKQRQEARTSGRVISESDLKNAEKFTDSWTRLKASLEGIRNTIGSVFTPKVTDVLDKWRTKLEEWMPQIRAWVEGFSEKLPGALKQLGGQFKELWASAQPWIEFGGAIVERFGPVNSILAALAVTVGGPLVGGFLSFAGAALVVGKALVAALVPAVIAVGKAVWVAAAPFAPILLSIAALAAGAYLIWKHWEPIKAFFADTWESLKVGASFAWDWISDGLSKMWDKVKATLTDGWNWLANSKVGEFLGLSPSPSTSKVAVGGRRSIGGPVFNMPPAPPAGGTAASPLASSLGRLEAAAREGDAARGARSKTDINVRFENLPRGARTQVASNEENLSLSQGWAMAW